MKGVLRGLFNKLQRSIKRRGFWGTLAHASLWPFYSSLDLIRRNRPSQRRAIRLELDFDRKFGVDTAGRVDLHRLQIPSPNWVYGEWYSATPPDTILSVIRDLGIRCADFVFVDLGSGKGRVVLQAAEFPFQKVIGVEFSPELNLVAHLNFRNYPRERIKCKSAELLCQDAAEFEFPHEPTVLYMFNPFREQVMSQVLANLRRSLQRAPRQLFIVYYHPVRARLLDEAPFLQKIKSAATYLVYTNSAAN